VLWPHCSVCGLTLPRASVWLQIVELHTWELHTGVGGWMMFEVLFLSIMPRATHVQRMRVQLPCLFYRQVVVCNIRTQRKPDVSELRHRCTCRLTLVTLRHWLLHLDPFGICTPVRVLLLLLLAFLELPLGEAFYHGWKCAWIWAMPCII